MPSKLCQSFEKDLTQLCVHSVTVFIKYFKSLLNTLKFFQSLKGTFANSNYIADLTQETGE